MKQTTYLLLLLPLLAAQSCSKEIGGGEEESGPVSLSPRIAGISLTRAGIDDAKDIDAIGFYAVGKQDDTDKTYGTFPTGTYGKYIRQEANGHNTFVPAEEAQTLWLEPEKDAIIFSCHPAPVNGGDIVDASTLKDDGTEITPAPVVLASAVPVISIPSAVINLSPTLPADNSGNTLDFTDPKNDYMYGVTYNTTSTDTDESTKYGTDQPIANGTRTGGTVNQSGPIVAIGLKHAFTQIRLVIKKGETYPSTATVSEVKYTRSMRTLTANAKMKLTDGTFLGATDAAAYTYNLTSDGNSGKPIASTSEKDNLIITSYALPCAAAASTISLTVDGKEMSIKYDGDPAWLAGKIYTYAVTINGTGLSFSGVSVVSWNNSADNNSSGTL